MTTAEFDRAFERLRGELRAAARLILRDGAEAEDVVHDAWLKARDRNELIVDSPSAWLATTVRRLSFDRLRHRRVVQRHVESTVPDPDAFARNLLDDIVERAEARRALDSMFAVLSDAEVAAVILREVFGDGVERLAALSRMTPGATRVMLHRALRRLRVGRPRQREVGRHSADDAVDRAIVHAVCWQSLTSRDAGLLRAFLAETAQATSTIVVDATTTTPPIRLSFVERAGRARLALRQGPNLICTLPAATPNAMAATTAAAISAIR